MNVKLISQRKIPKEVVIQRCLQNSFKSCSGGNYSASADTFVSRSIVFYRVEMDFSPFATLYSLRVISFLSSPIAIDIDDFHQVECQILRWKDIKFGQLQAAFSIIFIDNFYQYFAQFSIARYIFHMITQVSLLMKDAGTPFPYVPIPMALQPILSFYLSDIASPIIFI